MSDDTPWRAINPPQLAKPIGYSYAVESKGTRRLTIAGQVAMDADGKVLHRDDILGQATLAFENLKAVLDEAGAEPKHLVRMRIFTTDIPAYQAQSREIGKAYRACFGKWFPAMTLVQVAGLFDDGAMIEVEGEAMLP